MKKLIFIAIVLSGSVLFFADGAKAANIKEGQWSMTTTIHMDGMDNEMAQAQKEMENMSAEEKAMMEKMMGGMGMKMGAGRGGMGMSTTITQCLTNDNPVPESSNQENCEQTHTINGNTVNFEMVCDNSHSTGQVTYRGDAMRGTIQSTSTENGKQENVTIDINGEYVGPCVKNLDAETSKKVQAAARKGDILSNENSTSEEEDAAVNTRSNKVKNALGGIKSLLGR